MSNPFQMAALAGKIDKAYKAAKADIPEAIHFVAEAEQALEPVFNGLLELLVAAGKLKPEQVARIEALEPTFHAIEHKFEPAIDVLKQ